MKFMKRAQIYRASNYNVTFDPKKIEAISYKWWRFVAVVEGVLLFNNYRYSVTTAKHQSKVSRVMHELGLTPDVTLRLPRGIRHDQTLAELYLEAEEYECDRFLEEEEKKISRNEKAQKRRLEQKAKEEAQFKANMDQLTFDDIRAHRAGLILVTAEAVQGE